MFDSLGQILVMTAVITAIAAPINIIGRNLMRRRGRLRNSRNRCGRCDRPATEGAALEFVADGVFVCESCATRYRRQLRFTLPPLAILTLVASASVIATLVGGSSIIGQVGRLGTYLIPFVVPGALWHLYGAPGWKAENRRALQASSDQLGATLQVEAIPEETEDSPLEPGDVTG
jgi:hypothetical protein